MADWPSQSFHFFPIEAANVVVVVMVNEGFWFEEDFPFVKAELISSVLPQKNTHEFLCGCPTLRPN